MPEMIALRTALKSFLGDELYSTFIEKGFDRRGELRYWQQKEWDRFIAAHPEFTVGPEDLAVAMRICHLHGDELLPGTADVFHGCLDYAQDYMTIRNEWFPNAQMDVYSTEGAPGTPFDGKYHQVDVWFCPTCRAARAKWEEIRAQAQ